MCFEESTLDSHMLLKGWSKQPAAQQVDIREIEPCVRDRSDRTQLHNWEVSFHLDDRRASQMVEVWDRFCWWSAGARADAKAEKEN